MLGGPATPGMRPECLRNGLSQRLSSFRSVNWNSGSVNWNSGSVNWNSGISVYKTGISVYRAGISVYRSETR